MYIKQAEEKRGKTLAVFFPKRFPIEHLAELKSSMSTYLWSCNYLNNPMPDEAQTFKLSNLGFWCGDRKVLDGKITEAASYRNRFTILDPAVMDTDESDYSAFVTVGMDSEWNIFLEEIVREKIVGNDPILNLLFEIRDRWSSLKVGIEATAFQKSLIFGFKAQCRERVEYFKVTELTPSTKVSKRARIRGFEPFVSGGRVFLKVKDGTDLTLPAKELYYALERGHDVLADEMLRFPLGSSDDCIDALAHLPALAFPRVLPAKKKVHAENTFGAFQEILKSRRQRVRTLTPT
jgi:phage terminase large subunit-like protein